MDTHSISSKVTKASLSRDGRYLLTIDDTDVVNVYFVQPSSSTTSEIREIIWKSVNVRSALWHFDLSIVLVLKKNGNLAWKSFCQDHTMNGSISADHLLRQLVAQKLEFDCLNSITLISFQRHHAILKTSSRQVVALELKVESGPIISWAYQLSEFEILEVCDRCFVVFEPLTPQISIYSLFTGKLQKKKSIRLSELSLDYHIREASVSPNGEYIALLTNQVLLVGEGIMEIPDISSQHVTKLSLGDENMVFIRDQPLEYLLYNYRSKKLVHTYLLKPTEILVLCQLYNRFDKILSTNMMFELKPQEDSDIRVKRYAYSSMLANALASQHFESCANVLKIAENSDQAEVIDIVHVLNEHLQINMDDHKLPFVLQKVIGSGLRFACQAYLRFPDCPKLLEFIFKWQDVLTGYHLKPFQSDRHHEQELVVETEFDDTNESVYLLNIITRNILPIGQQTFLTRGKLEYRSLTNIREIALDRLARDINSSFEDFEEFSKTELIVKNLGCSEENVWDNLILKIVSSSTRRDIVNHLVERSLCAVSLRDSLDFLELIENFANDIPHLTSLKNQAVKKLEKDEQKSLLAEMFFQHKETSLLGHLQPIDVWKVVINRQIISGMKKWIEAQPLIPSSTLTFPYCWSIGEDMIDFVACLENSETRETVLNLLALQGIFADKELQLLSTFVARIIKIKCWQSLDVILQKKCSNVCRKQLLKLITTYCYDRCRTSLLWDVLNQTQILRIDLLPLWAQFVYVLHHNRRSFLSSYLEEILDLSYRSLEEKKAPVSLKFPIVSLGASFLACLGPIGVRRNSFNFLATSSTCDAFFNSTNFENAATVVFLSSWSDSLVCPSVNPSCWSKLNSTYQWFFLIPNYRIMETFLRMSYAKCIDSFTLAAIYAYGINRCNRTLSGMCFLLARMCSSTQRNNGENTKIKSLNLWNPTQKVSNSSEVHCDDENLSDFSYTHIADLLEKLLVTHEEQCESNSSWGSNQHVLTKQSHAGSTFDALENFCKKSEDSGDSSTKLQSTWQALRIAVLADPIIFSSISPKWPSIGVQNQITELTCLTIMAQHAKSLTCLYRYMAFLIPTVLQLDETPPDVESVCNLIILALKSSKFNIIVEALNVIVPGELLTQVFNWIHAFSNNSEAKTEEELFRDISKSSQVLCDQITYSILFTLFHSSGLLSWCCDLVVRDVKKQLTLVLSFAKASETFLLLREIIPNLDRLSVLAQVCLEFNISIKTSILLSENPVKDFEKECAKIVKVLLKKRYFARALEVAKSCGLPIDSILVTQLSTNLSRLLNSTKCGIRSRTSFWHRCSNFFASHRVRPEVASGFFLTSRQRAISHREAHIILDLSLMWAKRSASSSPESEGSVIDLEITWWETRIEADEGDNWQSELQNSTNTSLSPSLLLLRSKLENATRPFSLRSRKHYSPFILEKVTHLINVKLDSGDLFGAAKLSCIFDIITADLELILILMRMVENGWEISQGIADLEKIRKMKPSLLEIKDRFLVLQLIAELVRHGNHICDRIIIFYQVASALDMKYEYVVEHPKPLCILKMLIEHSASSNARLLPGPGGLFKLATQWITAANLNPSEVVSFVQEELVETVRCAQSKICDAETSMLISLLQGTFNRWVTLCQNPTELGIALMTTASRLQETGEWVTAVEILIFAHSSFTLACNVENIRLVLNQARCFVDELALNKNWVLVTRLVTGLQRYADMNYVFVLMREVDQFEYFLRKGMDRLPLLRQALLDFLRPNSLKNRELFRLVALHFHMHAEVATLWKEEANSLLQPLINQAQNMLVRGSRRLSTTPSRQGSFLAKQTSTDFSSSEPSALSLEVVQRIGIDQDTRNKLSAAMHNLVHAAEYFIQAGKLQHADNCLMLAELSALQLGIMNRTKSDCDAICVLGLNPSQVHHLIERVLTYPEGEILSRCYKVNVSWSRSLFFQYVLDGKLEYYDAFIRRQFISSALIEEMLVQLETHSDDNPEQLERFSKILAVLPDAELSYRLGSRLSLISLVTNILSSHCVPFLKDKVWASA